MTIDCDVLVIGSGAAGAVLAATLAERTGLRIILVERGGHFGREAMTGREWQMCSGSTPRAARARPTTAPSRCAAAPASAAGRP